MIDRLDLETLSQADEKALLGWQLAKGRFDGLRLFNFHEPETKTTYLDTLKSLSFEEPYLAGLAEEAKKEDGEAARLKLVELSLQIADLFPLVSKSVQ